MDYNVTYREKDGGIQAIVSYKKDGKWKQESKQGFKKKKTAKTWADGKIDELKEKFELQESMPSEHDDIIFKDFSEKYIEHKQLYCEYTTIVSVKTALKHFKQLNNINMKDITPYDIQQCVDEMVRQGLVASTIKQSTSIIKTLFNTATDPLNIIEKNPVHKILMPKEKKKSKGSEINLDVKALTFDELEGLLSKITYRKHYIASLLAGKCGLRIGEIVGLTWDCIDYENAQIIINKQWKLLDNKKWGFGTTKSSNSNRRVPAPKIVLNELKKFREEYPIHISNRILPYADSTNLSNTLSKCYKRIGYNITVLNLRHTYATLLIAKGMDFKTAAKLLGHTVQMTMKIYSHVTSDMLDKAAKVINEIF